MKGGQRRGRTRRPSCRKDDIRWPAEDPPEIDDDFELPPPAIDISIDFGELFPLGAAALIGDDLAAGRVRTRICRAEWCASAARHTEPLIEVSAEDSGSCLELGGLCARVGSRFPLGARRARD